MVAQVKVKELGMVDTRSVHASLLGVVGDKALQGGVLCVGHVDNDFGDRDHHLCAGCRDAGGRVEVEHT